MLEDDKRHYRNYTGCGNTLDASNPFVRRMIIDSLRHWVSEMHVDGFRFDLASILSRDEEGSPIANPPILWDIESDPVLCGVKLIAEAWDAAGLYQVGSFIGDSWKEWNGKFRDDVRSFIRGDRDSVSKFVTRMLGSPDIYGHEEREPEQAINFVTCHDGFTLNDLVSYDRKHNEANGEGNRDGSDDNLSWNCGAEGPTDDPEVERLRERQARNFLAATLLAAGTPMLLMGDEVRRTQQGNNNAYGQDNEISWFDWGLAEKRAGLRSFVKRLIASRLRRDLSLEDTGLTLNQLLNKAKITWHGVKLHKPDWGADSHAIALTLRSLTGRLMFHFMINAYWGELAFEVPPAAEFSGEGWKRWIDTSLEPPDDISDWEEAVRVSEAVCRVQPRSWVVLVSRVKKN